MTVNLAGFIAGAVIARENGVADDDVAKFGLVGALFPSPVLGAVVVQGLTDTSGGGTSAQQAATDITVTVPDSTDDIQRNVYLAGTLSALDKSLSDWDPQGIQLTRVDHTHWTTTLTGPGGANLQYKFTLGDWDSVELDASCHDLSANRALTLPAAGTQDTRAATVANWKGFGPCAPGGGIQ